MTNIASKNLYDLLGNDPEQDPDREPEPPTKAIDKPVQRSGKRNAGAEGPSDGTARPRGGGRGGRHETFSGNEAAFRGNYNNRGRGNPDDGARQDRHPDRLRDANDTGYRGRGRGSRGGRGARGGFGGAPRDDRHSKTGISNHEKQAAHGWGGATGNEEWADEKAGAAIAKEEEKEGFDTNPGPPVNADGEALETQENGQADGEAEPEDKSKSYDAYLAEQAEKKLSLGLGSLEARKANEGASTKFPEGKAFARGEDEDFISGTGGKAGRVREKKQKETIQLDDERLHKAPDMGGRGGSRGGRGGRGDSFRGGEGRGRGGRGRGDRGGFRGDSDRGARGRGGRGGPAVNVNDKSAFPTLGS